MLSGEIIIIIMAWLRERRLRRGSSTSPAGTLVADKADAGEACPVAVVAGEGLVWKPKPHVSSSCAVFP